MCRMDNRAREHVRAHFFSYSESEVVTLLKDLRETAESVGPRLRQVAGAFEKNLLAVLVTAAMPHHIVWTSAAHHYFEKILIAEKIRTMPLPGEEAAEPEGQTTSEAFEVAKQKLLHDLKAPRETSVVKRQVIAELAHLLEDEDVASAASELLRQSDVLVWGALEVLINDLFIVLMNSKPELTGRLLRDERTPKRFQLKDTMPMLERFSYDLSHHMGDVLAEHFKIDDVQAMRDVFDVLLDEPKALRDLLLQDVLWRLFQRRNLILHRRGIVDSLYLSNTGDTLPLGSEIVVTPDQLRKDFQFVRDVGIELLRAVSNA